MHVLILPNWKDTEKQWQGVIKPLEAAGYMVTYLDYTEPESDDIEPQVLQAETHLTQKTIVVGYDVGGRIAVQLCSRNNHQIIGGMLIATPSIPFTGLGMKIFSYIRLLFVPMLLLTPYTVKKWFSDLTYRVLHPKAEERMYRKIITSSQDTLLQVMKVRMKLVWGKHDRIVPEKTGHEMNELLPKSDFIQIATAGHDLPFSHSRILAEVIDGYRQEL